MLNKSKSNRIHLLKYTLFIPMVFGMLIYTSCQIEADGTTTESLDKFSYTEKMPVEMTEALKKARGQFESFLINNKDYVAWAETDYEKSEVNYSIHKKDEKTPVGFTGMQVNFENGDSYMIYRDLSEEKQTSKEMHQDSGTFKDASEMPLSVIDEVPTTEACEKLATNDEKRDCLSFTISDFVNKNFNTNLGKELGLKGRQRIMVIFMIEKDGQIGDVRAKSQHPGLEAEAIRVVKMLPKMSPGMHNGKPMAVPYHLPILFQVGE